MYLREDSVHPAVAHYEPSRLGEVLSRQDKQLSCFSLTTNACVSKIDQQDTRAQVKTLKEAGCRRIFEEHASGGRWERPELHRALDQLR
jgi:hypothetical protein